MLFYYFNSVMTDNINNIMYIILSDIIYYLFFIYLLEVGLLVE